LVGGRFVAGLHLAALIGAGLFVAAALITLASRQ
jgi:hypothetical protein